MTPIGQGKKSLSLKYKLYLVIGTLLFLIGVQLIVLSSTLYFLSAARGYVGGEGLWSKAQKNATLSLVRYIYSRDELDYQEFLNYLKIPLGDKRSRIELQKPNPDLNIAYEGFIAGGNQPADIMSMIYLFKYFQQISYLKKAIAIWTKGDILITDLMQKAEGIHQEILRNQPITTEKMQQIFNINAELTTLENNFSYTLGEASRWLEGLVLKVLVFLAVVFAAISIILLFFIINSIRRQINEIQKVANLIKVSDFSQRAEVYREDEIGLLAESFNQMTDALEENIKTQQEISEMKAELISIVNHELRTPLTAIKGSIALILGSDINILPERSQKLLAIANNNTERLIRLINDLLDIEKLESGHMEFHLIPIDLTKLSAEAISLVKYLADKAQVKLELISDNASDVKGDYDRLMQVVINLLSNSIRYSPAKEKVTVVVKRIDQMMRVSVNNHGDIIPRAFYSRIFKKFSQADSFSQQGKKGSGLGLNICKAIIEKHGGTINFTSNEENGTTFYFDLPC